MAASAFTDMEQAALAAIFAETPDIQLSLAAQLREAEVLSRENTGAGFFTTISVPSETARVDVPGPLALTTYARIEGLRYGLGFVMFLKDGHLDLLEGFSCGGEDTSKLLLGKVSYRIAETPFDN